MTITIVPATSVQIVRMDQNGTPPPSYGTGWFGNMLSDLFREDPTSRITSDQIAQIFNRHYVDLGLPDLSTNSREVGRQLAKLPKIGRHLLNGRMRYHLSLKPELDIPGLVYDKGKPYQKLTFALKRTGVTTC